jgi:N-carbamoylputrescine amidase
MTSLSVGLVQMRMDDDPAANTDRAEAAAQGARLVCLPELFRSPYFCKTEDHGLFALAEPVPGPTTARFESLTRELDVTILASLFEKRAEGLYHNTLAVVRPDGYAGKYRKMHIPDDPLFYEKFYFTPGDLGFRVFDVPAGDADDARIGTLVCWDQWYPEAARLTAMQGAAVLFYPTAIGWMKGEEDDHAAQQEAWTLIQRSHAVANGCYVCAANRIGFEPTPGADDPEDGIMFWGGSFVAGPDGQVLASASADREEVLVVDLDLSRIGPHRTTWPFLRDRRIDAYAPLTRRYLDDD